MTDTPSTLQRFLREPLFHFLLIGAFFFLLYSGVNDPTRNVGKTIVISPTRISQLSSQFKGIWNRKPTVRELDRLIEEEIRSEVYYRDALELGLDRNDTMVRRRLRQKMEFLTDTGIFLQEPTEEDVKSYFTSHKQSYSAEALLAFEQVYLGRAVPDERVAKTLQTLRSSPSMSTSSQGQPSRLPTQLGLSRPAAIDSIFGKDFYKQLRKLESGKWDGPVKSAYGLHLVRTLDGRPGHIPELDDVRNALIKDWKTAKANENRENDYVERRSRYRIEVIREADTNADAAQGKE